MSNRKNFRIHLIKVTSFFMVLYVFTSCSNVSNEENELDNTKRTTTVTDIVKNSIKNHGGSETWSNLTSLNYNKTVLLFDSLGTEESRVTQAHSYNLQESTGSISWTKDDTKHELNYTETDTTWLVNSIEDTSRSASAKRTVDAAFFVLFQPFKLLGDGVSLEYVGKDTLRNGPITHVIQPRFQSDGPDSDRWWFYFDVNNYLLMATKVWHVNHFSMIENLELDSTTAITFNHHRKSYFVDSLDNIRYLRAEYFYDDFEMTSGAK